jgi:hypothetical protein
MIIAMDSDLVVTNASTSVVVYQPWDIAGPNRLAGRSSIEEELRDR